MHCGIFSVFCSIKHTIANVLDITVCNSHISYLNDALNVLFQVLCLRLLSWRRVWLLVPYGFILAALVAMASSKGLSLLASAQFQVLMQRALALSPQFESRLYSCRNIRFLTIAMYNDISYLGIL